MSSSRRPSSHTQIQKLIIGPGSTLVYRAIAQLCSSPARSTGQATTVFTSSAHRTCGHHGPVKAFPEVADNGGHQSTSRELTSASNRYGADSAALEMVRRRAHICDPIQERFVTVIRGRQPEQDVQPTSARYFVFIRLIWAGQPSFQDCLASVLDRAHA